MAEPTSEAPPPAPTRAGTPARVLAGIAACVGLANLVLASALGSYVGQNLPDSRVAAGLVGFGAVVVVAVLPTVLGAYGLRKLIARGIKVRFPRTLAALVVGWNGLLLGGLLFGSPIAPGPLLAERGTWIVDAARGVGPFGPAAGPAVTRRIEEAAAIDTLAGIAPYLADETARGLGAHWLAMMDGTRRGAAQESRIDILFGRYGIDPEAFRADPTALPEDLDGRGLVADLGALLKDAKGPTFLGTEWIPVGAEPVALDRTTLDLGEGRQARYEDGAWRLYLGDVAALTAGTAQQLAAAQQGMEGLPSTTPPVEATADVPEAPEPAPDPYAEARAALEAALLGDAGLMAGTTAAFESWPEALTRAAAVDRAEALRQACAAASADDPVFATEHTALRDKYALGEALPLDPAARAALAARGRRYLADVLELCAPVLRKPAEPGIGGPVSDARRARWARLDAADQASQASFEADGDGLRATVGAQSWRVVQEDGAWRVDRPAGP